MAPVATRRKKKNKAGTITAEAAERIIATALENPGFGADRLAQRLRREGMDVTRSVVYRTLCDRGLHTRELRARFLSEQNRLRELADSRQPRDAPAPALSPDVREQPIGPLGPSASIPGIEYAPPPVTDFGGSHTRRSIDPASPPLPPLGARQGNPILRQGSGCSEASTCCWRRSWFISGSETGPCSTTNGRLPPRP